jgi:hypothetical protein
MPGPAVAVKGELAALVAWSRPLTASSARGGWLVMTRRRSSALNGQRKGRVEEGVLASTRVHEP